MVTQNITKKLFSFTYEELENEKELLSKCSMAVALC